MSIECKITGDTLTIKASLDGTSRSASGKNIVLASTSGFVEVPNSDVKLSLNVIRKPKK